MNNTTITEAQRAVVAKLLQRSAAYLDIQPRARAATPPPTPKRRAPMPSRPVRQEELCEA